MKWTVLTSVILCAATFVTALSFLAVSCLNLTSTENLFPLPGITEWRRYLVHMIVISVFTMVISVSSCWGATRRNGYVAMAILISHLAALSVCIIYSNIIYDETENCHDDPFVIKNKTLEEYRKHRSTHPKDHKWIPDWLDSVQKQSPSCCGVVGFEDWMEFWPQTKRQVPESCCRTDSNCISDFDQIDWPKKPMDYIKNDEGCAATMSRNAARRVEETLKFLIVLIILLLSTIIGFALQFILDFWTTGGRQRSIEEDSKSTCFSWARVKFRRKAPPTQSQVGDPNGNADINLEQLAEVGSYSYTYLEQVKQQQSEQQQPDDLNDSQALMQQNFGNEQQQQQQQQRPYGASKNPQKIPPQSYTYEVLPNDTSMYMNNPNMGSSQSLPDDQQPGSQQERETGQKNPLPIIYPDDTEKQNLKQLLRFGRRHRRHRKPELDPDRQQ